ncbi:chromosome partitioning protein ParB [Clostridia bacterium]|nr:chromosome partitioning protein ParB [Clostridia bacterium]
MALKKGLGKGLDALFSDSTVENGRTTENVAQVGDFVREIDVLKIEPNSNQPRKFFDGDKLRELADSIGAVGVIQPIIVREINGAYEIIAGERRYRAARLAGLTTIPAVIRDFSPLQTVEAALIENIQRADLNPIEEASCYQKLLSEHSFTQEKLAERIGKSRPHIANLLRLLTLSVDVREFVEDGSLSFGHARALVAIADEKTQKELADKIISGGLSVRQTEKLVNEFLNRKEKQAPVKTEKSLFAASAERDLQSVLGAKVVIAENKNKGKIEIEFSSTDELDRLVLLLKSLN